MTSPLERRALQQRLRVGDRSRIVLRILDKARAPLTARDIYTRARTSPLPVSMATIRRTLNQLTAAGLLRALSSRARHKQYEKAHREQREALIDRTTGRRLEFHSEGIEELLKHTLVQLGYRLLDYRLELFGVADREAGSPHSPTLTH